MAINWLITINQPALILNTNSQFKTSCQFKTRNEKLYLREEYGRNKVGLCTEDFTYPLYVLLKNVLVLLRKLGDFTYDTCFSYLGSLVQTIVPNLRRHFASCVLSAQTSPCVDTQAIAELLSTLTFKYHLLNLSALLVL